MSEMGDDFFSNQSKVSNFNMKDLSPMSRQNITTKVSDKDATPKPDTTCFND